MELIWGPDFAALAEVARSVFTRFSPLRDEPDDTQFGVEGLSAALAELDWFRVTDPADTDPDSAALGSVAALHVELGRALLDAPLLAAFECRELALRSGHPQGAALADAIGGGTLRAAPVLSARSAGGRLTGTTLFVPHAQRADRFLVGTADVLAIVAADHPQLSVEPLPNLGDRALSAVTFDAIPLTDVTVLADGGAVAELLDIVAQRAAVLQAAEVYGAGLELLARTVRYAKERQQFGAPIGRFQAVQYLCTDIALAVHLTSVFTRHAAALLDDGHPAGVAVAMMRTQASRAARTMVHCAHEVHAGIGYMEQTKLHLFTRAAKYWQFALGDEHANHRAIAAGLRAAQGPDR